MNLNLKSILGGLLPATAGSEGADVATHVVSALIGNSTLSAYNTAAQTAVRAVVTELSDGVDKLRAAFDKFESSNELVQNALAVGLNIVRAQGLTVPTEDEFVTHVKAAIADLAGALGIAVVASPAPASAPAAP